jgi:nitrogen regulatory protein PII
MHFKMLIALVEDNKTDIVVQAARTAGATGCTVINHARGEGLQVPKTFFGLNLEVQRDMVILLVEEHLSRHILETIAAAAKMDEPQSGVVFQIDVEDVIGITSQIESLSAVVEDEI